MSSKPVESHLLPLHVKMVLEKCAMIQLKSADIYRHLACQHAQYRELGTLWMKASREEEHHARQFDMLTKLKGGSIVKLNVELGDAAAVLERLDAISGNLQRAILSPLRSLEGAIKLEGYLRRFHSNSVTVCRDPELKKLLDAMMDNDTDHVQLFEKAREEWLPGKEVKLKVLDDVERLFLEIRKYRLTPEEVAKVAVKVQSGLDEFLQSSATGDQSEIRGLKDRLVEKSQGQVALIKDVLTRILPEKKRSDHFVRDLS